MLGTGYEEFAARLQPKAADAILSEHCQGPFLTIVDDETYEGQHVTVLIFLVLV